MQGAPNVPIFLKSINVIDNTALNLGGGVYIKTAIVHMESSTIKNNNGSQGGGIYLLESTLDLHTSEVISNIALFGTALQLEIATVDFYSSIFNFIPLSFEKPFT